MKKEANIRKCVVTRDRLQKEELLRVVRIDNTVKVDINGNLNGRGAYIKPQIEVIKKAQKKNAFARALRTRVEGDIYLDLLELVEKSNA